ncbi:CbtA family protein [Kineosporia mesophila]|uniref:CbtA family protein n=1 Tax=Kineosporia mesophila TaxID=566012 RepID=A0ABP7AKE9_9ACTN|nr:CbtA family protein [Kineosporia mesophila]MCD5355050.1 CbtA family protein [Kineosporia mesophila]
MEKKLILRGLLAGAVGGLLSFVFARIFAEPQIQAAIDYEGARDAAQEALSTAAHAHEGHEVFSRTLQGNAGIGVALILFGMAMGALFAIVYSLCLGRVGRIQPRNLSLLVAGAGFVGLYLVPFVKYPANPPAVGHEDSIRDRTDLYLLMVLASVVLLVLAVVLGQRLQARFGNWTATILAGTAYLVAVGVVMALLPQFGHLAVNEASYGSHASETPLPLTDSDGNIVFPGFPADLLFDFRLNSVAAQLIMWAAIGVVFAPMADRLLSPRTAKIPADPITA